MKKTALKINVALNRKQKRTFIPKSDVKIHKSSFLGLVGTKHK